MNSDFYKHLFNTVMEELNRQTNEMNNLKAIEKSTFWRLTKPARLLVGRFRGTSLLHKGLRSLSKNGVRRTWKLVKRRLNLSAGGRKHSFEISRKARNNQERKLFTKKTKFSIITPLYNTPPKFLRAMIESVINQTYKNWELCLADGSDNNKVKRIVKQYKDPRIVYKKLPRNLGISGNTNAAMSFSTGDYFAMLDHDDMLHPSALYEVMHVICKSGADFIYTDEITFTNHPSDAHTPNFKPDFAPDTLRANNYICHLSVYSRKLYKKTGGYRKRFDGSQDFDMTLRLTEKAKKITHIPKFLYYWRGHKQSVAARVGAKPYVIEAGRQAVAEHLKRINLKGEVAPINKEASAYRVRYEIVGTPLVSIIIPNKDHVDDLQKCISSVLKKSMYKNIEIIVVENNSEEPRTFAYYKHLARKGIKVITYKDKFNYSAINNFAAKHAGGEYLLFLNNDTKVISPPWIEEMLMFAQRPDVGAVGAKLLYPDDTIQHGGVLLGVGGVAAHAHLGFPRDHPGFMWRLKIAQNLTAVTGACLMTKRTVFEKARGFDEKFAVAFNDVDLCMRLRKKGYLVVFTPFAELYHYESKSRGAEDTPQKQIRFKGEIKRFRQRWAKELFKGDPYYNPNFKKTGGTFSI